MQNFDHLENQIRIRVFENVSNAGEIASASAGQGSVTFIDLSTVYSYTLLKYACLRASINESQGRLKTRQTVDVEIKYYLSASSKISECVRVLTPSGEGTCPLLALVSTRDADASLLQSIAEKVNGQERDPQEALDGPAAQTEAKASALKAAFKIGPTEFGSLESIIISRLAVKDL